jgi:hypothetical protein
MKNLNKLKETIFLGSFALILLFVACTRENLTQDLNFQVSSDFLINPITLQINNATNNTSIGDNVTIRIEGRDKGKIYSLLGDNVIKPIEGVAALAIKKNNAPTESNPLEFTVVVESPGYVSKHINYKLTSAEATVENVGLLNIVTPPTSISIGQQVFSSTATNDVKITLPANNLQVGNAEITIKPATTMMTADGTVLKGTVQSTLVHSDAKTVVEATALPGWGTSVEVKDKNGNSLGETVLDPVGYFELKMTIDGKSVEKFATPISNISLIDPNTFNPLKNRKIQVGDTLSVLSLSEGETVWKEESSVVVQNAANGKLKVSFDLNHLSHYSYGFFNKNYCELETKINSNITYSNDFCSVPLKSYFYKIVDNANPNKVYYAGWSHFGNGSYLGKCAFIKSANVRVLIYENQYTTPLYTSAAFNPCTVSSITIPNGKLEQTNAVAAKFNISAKCGNLTYVPSASLLYRDVNAPMNSPASKWRHLVSLKPEGKKAVGCVKGLETGKCYDYAVAIAMTGGKNELLTFSKCIGGRVGQSCLKMPQGDTTITVVSPVWNYTQTFQFTRKPGNIYELNYTNFPLPDNICDEIKKNFSSFVVAK